jgi:uncharacterized protein YaaR (DUF327 family)
MQTQRTHFEKIPVATVKKIAHEFSANSEREDYRHDSEPSACEDWRQVALRIQTETDSGKLIELVQELIEKYDNGTPRKER